MKTKKPNSGGTTPKKAGGKHTSYERMSVAEENRRIDKALARLGDEVPEYRIRRDRIVKRKIKK